MNPVHDNQENVFLRAEHAQDVRQAAADLHKSVAQASDQFLQPVSFEPFVQVLQQWSETLKIDQVADVQTAVDTVESLSSLSAMEAVKRSLNTIDCNELGTLTWTYLDRDSALRQAEHIDQQSSSQRGLLQGMTVGLKDMFDREGWTAKWGSQLRDASEPATQTASLVQRLEDAGAVTMGLQHMAELAMSPTGFNAWLSPGKNSVNPEHVSGGSSSGAGMSVGSGQVDIAMGSDTGGSIRLPAAFCEIVGLKPTQYRLSSVGAMPLSPSLDCLGPLTRDVQTCAAAFGVLDGQPQKAMLDLKRAKPQDFTIAVPKLSPSEVLSESMHTVFEHAQNRLRDLGMRIVEVALPNLGLYGQLSSVVLSGEAAAIHRKDLYERPHLFGDQVYRRLARGLLLSATDYYDAIRMREAVLRDFMHKTLGEAQALLLPTTPDVAPLVSATVGTDHARLEREFSAVSWWTRGINYLGLPAIALPAGQGARNLPLSVQFVGPPMGEESILSIAYLFEQHMKSHNL